jgi:hypothetical protein
VTHAAGSLARPREAATITEQGARMMEHEPEFHEDAKNLSVVTGSAILAGLITVGLLANAPMVAPETTVVREIRPVVVEETRAPLSGINRIYGTVTTVHGGAFT